MKRFVRRCALGAMTLALCLGLPAVQGASAQAVADPPSTAPPAAIVRQVARDQVVLRALDAPPDRAEAAALHRIFAGARVLGFGESGHGRVEPLAYRNRLIRYLVEHEGLTAVALESGLANTQPAGAYVATGAGEPAAAVAGLSWGFGGLPANLELVTWLRAWNVAHPRQPVHLYGIDASVTLTSRTAPELDGAVILGDVIAYLEKTVPDASGALRARLGPVQTRFRSDALRAMSAPERAALQADLVEAQRLFVTQARAMKAAAPGEQYEWAARKAHDLPQITTVLTTWTTDPREIEKLRQATLVRDQMMADNVQWALAREGRAGRILVFAANGHVVAAPMAGSIMREWHPMPDVMGNHLRKRLGRGYRVLVTASANGKAATDSSIGSIDRAFRSTGAAAALLALPPGQAGEWWGRTQTLASSFGGYADVVPAQAIDGIVFFDHLTPIPPPRTAAVARP